MESVSDDDLVLMYCNGDVEAFDVLFDRHYAHVYNFARTMLGNSGGPDEVLQEAFLAVAQKAQSYRPRGRFTTWLMRIVRNRCLNRLAAQRVRREATEAGGLEIVEPASPDPSPDQQAEDDEQTAIVRAAVAELPQRQREAITLYAMAHMSYRDTAEVMDMPINTVKTLIHRARATLARRLESLNRE